MTSIFSKIVQGDIPCHKVWEDEEHLAFLDIQPLAKGHTLVIPKRESDRVFDLSSARAEALWSAAHQVAQKLKHKVECERVAVLVLGYEVPHVHIHLIPTQSEAQVLNPKRQETNHPELAALAAHIRGEQAGKTKERAQLPSTKEVEERWDDFAQRFVHQVEVTSMRLARAGIDHLQLQSAHNILEIGCGGGGAGQELFSRLKYIKQGVKLTLSDISGEMVKITQSRFSEAELKSAHLNIVQADAQNLPFQDGSFDRIFSCLNLMLVPNAELVIKECARVLNSGGLGVWIVWGRPEHSHMMTLSVKALKQIGIEMPTPARSNFYLGGRDTLKQLLEQHGFTQVRRWYQAMMSDVTTGDEFTKMTLALRPELEDLIGPEQFENFKQKLGQYAQGVLDLGDGIGLDALIVVARKP